MNYCEPNGVARENYACFTPIDPNEFDPSDTG